MRAREVMSAPVFTVEPDVAIQDAARLLLRHAITAAPVVTAAGELVGMMQGLAPTR